MVLMTLVKPHTPELFRRFGQLVAIEKEPIPKEWDEAVDGPWEGGPLYVVRHIHEDETTVTKWVNATPVAMPVALDTGGTIEGMFRPSPGRGAKSLWDWARAKP